MTLPSQTTIAAIASGQTPAAIGVLRLSGPKAIEIAQKLMRNKELQPRMMHYRKLYDASGEILDDVLLCAFKAPNSYTGEDTVEIYAHGGMVNLDRVLHALVEAGADLAQAGEFSKRAFLNGKIDLTQAEAIMDIIHAQNARQCEEAQRQLSGTVSETVVELRQMIMHLLVQIETAIDFSTEEELIDLDAERFAIEVADLASQLERLRRAHEQYRAEGLRCVLLGRPNAGKSSLFNRLLGRSRAIVTDIAGTTTDVIEGMLSLGGQSFCFVDTAGLGQSANAIEIIGIDRAREEIERADLAIIVADVSDPDALDIDGLDEIAQKLSPKDQLLFVCSKSDLSQGVIPEAFIAFAKKIGCTPMAVSSHSRAGLAELEAVLIARAKKQRAQSEGVTLITSQRHMAQIDVAIAALGRAVEAISAGIPHECVAADLYEASEALANITGAIASEDVLNEIFSHFCIGK